MNKQEIDFWLRRFDAMGIYSVKYNDDGYDSFLTDLEEFGFKDPLHLLVVIGRVVDS